MSLLDPSLAPAIAESRLLHHRGPDVSAPGFVAICQRTTENKRGWKQQMVSLDVAETVLHRLEGAQDAYMSQGTFVSKRRAIATSHLMGSLYVDLDCYRQGLEPHEGTAEAIVEHMGQAGVAAPSLICHSGRGMYAKWVLDGPVSSSQMLRWRAAQQSLVAALAKFGADPKSRDSARVLRTLGSINSKSDRRVQVLHDSGERANFSALCDQLGAMDLGPLLEGNDCGPCSDLPQRERARHARRQIILSADCGDMGLLEQYAATREPIMMRQFSIQSLHWCRFLDLRDLAMMRGGIWEGWRDTYLFWMSVCLAHAGVLRPANFRREIGELAQAFPQGGDFRPMHDGSLGTLYRRLVAAHDGKLFRGQDGYYSKLYTAKNEELINQFGITSLEQQRMRTLIDQDEKRRRADAKVPGRAENRQARQERPTLVLGMIREGKGPAEIAQSLQVDLSTVYRTRKALQTAGVLDAKGKPVPGAKMPTPGKTKAGRDEARFERRGRRSPYMWHRQALPPSAGGLQVCRRSPLKLDPSQYNAEEIARRRRAGPLPPDIVPPDPLPTKAPEWATSRSPTLEARREARAKEMLRDLLERIAGVDRDRAQATTEHPQQTPEPPQAVQTEAPPAASPVPQTGPYILNGRLIDPEWDARMQRWREQAQREEAWHEQEERRKDLEMRARFQERMLRMQALTRARAAGREPI